MRTQVDAADCSSTYSVDTSIVIKDEATLVLVDFDLGLSGVLHENFRLVESDVEVCVHRILNKRHECIVN